MALHASIKNSVVDAGALAGIILLPILRLYDDKPKWPDALGKKVMALTLAVSLKIPNKDFNELNFAAIGIFN